MKNQDTQNGIVYIEGLFFLNKKGLKSDSDIVKETIDVLYQYINYN